MPARYSLRDVVDSSKTDIFSRQLKANLFDGETKVAKVIDYGDGTLPSINWVDKTPESKEKNLEELINWHRENASWHWTPTEDSDFDDAISLLRDIWVYNGYAEKNIFFRKFGAEGDASVEGAKEQLMPKTTIADPLSLASLLKTYPKSSIWVPEQACFVQTSEYLEALVEKLKTLFCYTCQK